MRLSRLWVLVTLAFLANGATRAEPPPRVIESQPAADWNARFAADDGWIGGDGVYSIALADDRVLFLFGDTLLGKVSQGRRSAQMVNNTVGLFSLADAGDGIRFASGQPEGGKPTAVFKPAGGGWFWPHAGILLSGRLYIFLAHIEKAGKDGPFGFKQIGEYLALIDNPLDAPLCWRIEQRRLPFDRFDEGHEMFWGAAIVADGAGVYVYGISDRRKQLGSKQLIAARAPLDKLADFDAWQFQCGAEWLAKPTADGSISGLANEFSVSRLGRRFVLVYTESGLSERIVGRCAGSPAGPWSDPVLVYRCPEAGDEGLFCYAAKAHPWTTGENELLISYCTNAWDFQRLFADNRVYRPRFVRVRIGE